MQLSAQKYLVFMELCFFWFQFVYYRFSLDKGLVFGLQDTVDQLEVLVRLCAFSGGNDFIVRVSSGCGNYFLSIADSYNLAPAASNAIVF